MKATYKAYDADGNAVVFHSVSAAASAMDLSFSDRKMISMPGVHTTSCGNTIITYID